MGTTAQRCIADYTKTTRPRELNDGILAFVTDSSAIKTSGASALSIGATFSGNQKMTVDWICKHHSDLGKEQLYAILKLRAEVFIVEQQCAYQDVDGQDLEGDTCHLMAWDGNQLVAYLRLLDPELQGGDVVIGRVIIAPHARGAGLGHALMDQALEQIEERWPQTPIYLSAQTHLQGYYGRYGFVVTGEEFVEDGIPHIGMRRP
jgi:ElaA protein